MRAAWLVSDLNAEQQLAPPATSDSNQHVPRLFASPDPRSIQAHREARDLGQAIHHASAAQEHRHTGNTHSFHHGGVQQSMIQIWVEMAPIHAFPIPVATRN